LVLVRQGERPKLQRADHHAVRAARPGDLVDEHDLGDQPEPERADGERETMQPQHRTGERVADERDCGRGQEHRERGGQAVMGRQDRRRVGRRGDQSGMPDAELPAKPIRILSPMTAIAASPMRIATSNQ
jgi:hypothetical protein